MKNLAFLLTLLISLLTINLQGQSDGTLKQKTKSDETTEEVKKPTIQIDENDLDPEEKMELEQARERAKAKNVKTSDEFKKRKVGIDKNREKLYAKKAAYKEKLDSGKWSKDKYKKKMAKMETKEDKIEDKKQKLLESLMSK